MRKIMMLAVLVGALLVGEAHAVDMKVAILDGQMVMNQTNAFKRAVDTMKGAREAARKQVSALEAPLVEKQKKLADQQKVLAPDKFAAEKAAFQKDVMAFRSKVEGIQVELDKKEGSLRKQISDVVRGIVDKLAKERGYDMVLPTRRWTSKAVPCR